nr:helitron helicase-like domain-containing protein [Tanacetum cinerariifolium]
MEAIHARRPAQLLEDSQLYLDVFQKYFECCGGKSRRQFRNAFEGTVLSTGLRRANLGKRRLQTDADNSAFDSYSSLCSNNTEIHGTCATGTSTNIQPMCNDTTASAFAHDQVFAFAHDQDPHNAGPLVSNQGCSLATAAGSSHTYDDLGGCTQCCRYCCASFWYSERLKGHSQGQRAEYHLCCSGGRIYMEPAAEPPEYIK